MKCLDYPLKYIEQTGITLDIRRKEHIHLMRSNNSNSGYSKHLLNVGHACGTITDTIDIIKTREKGSIEIH
jgi:hypothetical protein